MLTRLLLLLAIVALLLLCRLAWRTQPMLAVGIGAGLLLGVILGMTVEIPQFDSIPIWLPPLPFAIVASALFFFGILAWFWGDDRSGGESQDSTGTKPGARSDAPSSH